MQRVDATRLARRHAPSPSTDAPPADASKASTTSTSTKAASSARASEAGEPARAPDKARGGSKQVISLDEFLVEGKLEKPSAYYILRRSSADHDWARLDARFLPLVLESVQDPLF